jgi:D-glucosaminate-specific PTS system IIB component
VSTFVLLTHGNWGQTLVEDVKKQFGSSDELIAFPLALEADHEEYLNHIRASIGNKQSLVFISDLNGSTTYKVGLRLALEFDGEAYTDLSLRLLLDLLSHSLEKRKKYENVVEAFKNYTTEDTKMEEIKFARVDHRLIHGQVITKWMKLVQANKIVILDDNLGKDAFMVDIYKMAAPAGVDVEILDTQTGAERFNTGAYQKDKVFVLFKNIASVEKAVNHGLKLTSLQLGGIPYEQGRTKIISAVSLLPKEIEFLETMTQNGTEIIAQIVPEESSMSFAEIKSKF